MLWGTKPTGDVGAGAGAIGGGQAWGKVSTLAFFNFVRDEGTNDRQKKSVCGPPRPRSSRVHTI